VDKHRRIKVFEATALRYNRLTPIYLLRGRPDRGDASARVIDNATDSHSRADRTGRDEVMTAGVSKAGQGVVLSKEGDARALAATGGAKGRAQVAEGPFDKETTVLKIGAKPGSGLFLLEPRFGIVVDAMAEIDQGIALRVDLLGSAGLEGIDVLGHGILSVQHRR